MKPPAPLSDGRIAPVSVNAAQTPRDRLIAAASGLFGRYGINAIGVDAIVEAAGTAKTTLYKAFGSKEKLVETVLELEGERWRRWFFETIDGPGGAARSRLDRIFPALATWFAGERFYGCPLVNAVGENDKFDPRFREIAIQHKSKIEQRLLELLAEAGVKMPETAARQTMLLIEGAIASALLQREGRAAEVAQGIFEALLKPSSLVGRATAAKTGPQRSVKLAQ